MMYLLYCAKSGVKSGVESGVEVLLAVQPFTGPCLEGVLNICKPTHIISLAFRSS
jgi:hypothetical protein